MAYVSPEYPTDIPDLTDLREVIDDVDDIIASDHNDPVKELLAALAELGTVPKGSFADVKERLEQSGPDSRISVNLSADQSIPNVTWTKLLLNTKVIDNLTEFDAAVNYRFVAKKPGNYNVRASVEYKNSVKDLSAEIFVSLNTDAPDGCRIHDHSVSSKVGPVHPSCSKLIPLTTNDYLELWTRHDFGAAEDVDGDSCKTYMTIHKLS